MLLLGGNYSTATTYYTAANRIATAIESQLLVHSGPYLGTGAPNVLWTEGSAEMLLADSSLGQSTSPLSASLNAFAAVTPTDAPLMSDSVRAASTPS